VTQLLPFAVLCYYLASHAAGRPGRITVIGCLAAAELLIASTSTGLLPWQTAKLAQVYGAFVWAHLILLAALLVVLRPSRSPVRLADAGKFLH
jgi:hypothetical protein